MFHRSNSDQDSYKMISPKKWKTKIAGLCYHLESDTPLIFGYVLLINPREPSLLPLLTVGFLIYLLFVEFSVNEIDLLTWFECLDIILWCINLLKFATGLMNQCLEQLETMPTVFVEISRNRGVFFF